MFAGRTVRNACTLTKSGTESTDAHLRTQTRIFIHARAHKRALWGKTVSCRVTGKWQPTHTSYTSLSGRPCVRTHTHTHTQGLHHQGNAVWVQAGVREQVEWMQLIEFDDWGNLNTRAVIPFCTTQVKQTRDAQSGAGWSRTPPALVNKGNNVSLRQIGLTATNTVTRFSLIFSTRTKHKIPLRLQKPKSNTNF